MVGRCPRHRQHAGPAPGVCPGGGGVGDREAQSLALVAIALAIALALIDLRLHTGGFTSPYADDHGSITVMPFSGRPGFSYPAFFGILGIVFSLGKGLLFFAPGLFLPVRDRLAAPSSP